MRGLRLPGPAFPGSVHPAVLLVLAGLLVLGLAACGDTDEDMNGGAEGVPVPSSTVMGEPAVFSSEDGILIFTLPERWAGEVSVRESTPMDLEWTPPAPERVFQFILTPRDPRFAGENLFNLYVYDPAIWDGAGAEAASVGTEVARFGDRVYVADQAEENPFPEGSVDQGRFERFRMGLDEIREALEGG